MNYTFDYLNTLSVPEIHNLTTAELWSFVRGIYGISPKELSEATKVPYNSIFPSLGDKDPQYSKYSQILREYLLDFLDAKPDLQLLFKEANKYERVTYARISVDLYCSLSTVYACIMTNNKNSKIAHRVREYLENIINKHKPLENITDEEQKKEERFMQTIYNVDYLKSISKVELWNLAKKSPNFSTARMERNLNIPRGGVSSAMKSDWSEYERKIIKYLIEFLSTETDFSFRADGSNLDLKNLFNKANEYQNITEGQIARDLGCWTDTVSAAIAGHSKGKTAYRIKTYLENIINQYKPLSETIQKVQEKASPQDEEKEQETMTEETLTDTKEMKTYDEFLNFINTQKELPIVKKALEETLKENQNLDKILAKEEFITIETAQELNEKFFANEYTEEEILDFENQYFGTTDNDSLKDKIKSFVEKHNLSLETALKLLQISEEDYKKMLEGADKVSNKTADKIYKAISAFDEFYHSEKTQDTINNTKNTFVTGFAIASAKSQTLLNKGLNKFADFLNKSADKIKNSNSENKED